MTAPTVAVCPAWCSSHEVDIDGSTYHGHQPMSWPALDVHLLATVVDEPDGSRGEVGVYINKTSDDIYTLEELRAVARTLLAAADALEGGEAVPFG